jgi:hypothetical protein
LKLLGVLSLLWVTVPAAEALFMAFLLCNLRYVAAKVGTSSMIVGVCDTAALEKLSSFSAALLLTPQGSGAVADPDAVFRGMRKKNAAQCVQLDQRGYSAMGLVGT